MLNSRDFSDRQILATIRELRLLEQDRYKVVPLEEPIQKGWRRFHTLAKQSLDRQDRTTLEEILEVIGSSVQHHNRSFRCRRGRSKKLFEIEQPLRPIPLHEWERKDYPRKWHRYFHYELLLGWNRHRQPYWVFTQPSLYRLKTGPHWIHEVKQLDSATEVRVSELERWLESRQGRKRYDWLKGRPANWRDCRIKQRLLDKEQRREIATAYHTFPEVGPAAPVWRIPTSLRPILPTFPGVAQCRGNELRPRAVQVRVLPPGLFPTRSRSPTGRGTASRTPQVLVQIQPRSPFFGPEA
jgi:hypothetical protein